MSAQRNFGLDLVRAVAITAVFFSHGVTALRYLGCGVNLFFVLSGFLIGRIYLRSRASGDFSLMGFWKARWFRTLPPYLLALALFALANQYFHSTPVHLYYILFLQNFLGIDGFGPSWSLCVEEHFYLLLPLLGMLIPSVIARRHLVWVLPCLAVVPEFLRAALFMTGRNTGQWYYQSQFNAEGLVLGVWIAYLFVDRPELWKKLKPVAIPLSLIPLGTLLYVYLSPVQSTFAQVSMGLLFAVGFTAWVRLFYDILWTPSNNVSRLIKEAVHGLALASYSIYLVHTLVFTDVRMMVDTMPRGALKTGSIMAAGLAISVVFYFLVERPTILIRDRYLTANKAKRSPALTTSKG